MILEKYSQLGYKFPMDWQSILFKSLQLKYKYSINDQFYKQLFFFFFFYFLQQYLKDIHAFILLSYLE